MSRSACFHTPEADFPFSDHQPSTSWSDLVEEVIEAEAPVVTLPSWANVILDVKDEAKHKMPSPSVERGEEIREFLYLFVAFDLPMLCYL